MSMEKRFINFILSCVFVSVLVFSTPHLAIPAQPGLHLVYDGIGVYTWTSNAAAPFTGLGHWVKVVDHDGIAGDGSSHAVTVTYPEGPTKTLRFNHKMDTHSAVYEFWDDSIAQPIDPGTYSGTLLGM